MSAKGIRVNMSLVDLMQLNLVHRRLQTLADGEAFVHPEELGSLAGLMADAIGDGDEVQRMINEMRRTRG